MMSRLFEARDKIKSNDMEGLKKHLQKTNPDNNDCHNLLNFCFTEHRDKLIKIIQILKNYCNNILNIKLKEHPLLLDICRLGTADQLNLILKIGDITRFDRLYECVDYVVKITDRKDSRIMLDMVKVLYSIDGKIISEAGSDNIVELFEKQYFEVAEYIIDKGIGVDYQSKDKDNLLHILMKRYTKKQEKSILNLRNLLISKGVDERKINYYSKKPYDLCPIQFSKKFIQDSKSQTLNRKYKGDDRYKGRSQQGQFGRNKAHQFVDIKIDSQQEGDKIADLCVARRTKQKQKQLQERQKQKIGQKQIQKLQKIKKLVFSPQELKQFLNQQINYFVYQIQSQNQYQKSFLNQLIQKITKKIQQKVGATVRIFGSFATGLCLLQSDIDMVIIPQIYKQSQSSFSLLQRISYLLQSMTQQVQSVKYIKTASVPIIKIQCTKKYDSKKIDITYKDQNHNGLISVELIQKYLQIYTKLRPLVFVLKKFIYLTNIYDPYSGGLSSYGLIMMIVAYLQNDNRQKKSKLNNQNSKMPTVAQLLIGFLRFYGFKLNYINKHICVLDPQKAKQEIQATYIEKYQVQPIFVDVMDTEFMMYPNDWQPRAKLFIIDPLNPKNNIGRATHKIRQIKAAFQIAYVCLHTNKNCKNKKICQSYQRIMSVNLRNTKYEYYKRPCCILNRMMKSTKSLTIC